MSLWCSEGEGDSMIAKFVLLFIVVASCVGCGGVVMGGVYVPPPSTTQYREVPVALPSYTIGSGAGISAGGRTAPGTIYGFNSNIELEYRKLYPPKPKTKGR